MSNQSLGILASALTGGLAGATLTLVVNWIKGRWLRPQILVLFHNDEPGCRVDTNALGGTDPILRFVRLKVKNSGRSTALGVSVCVTKLTFTAPGAGSRTFEEDVIDLSLAYARPSPFVLAPGAHRYIDVAQVSKSDLSFSYVFPVYPVRLREQGFGTDTGTYGAEVFVSAENAEAEERFVTWTWDGKFPGLNITSNRAL